MCMSLSQRSFRITTWGAPCCRFTLMHEELWSCGWCWTCNVLDNTAVCLQPKPVPQALFFVFGSKFHTLKPKRVPTEILYYTPSNS
ncbi:unnamed protein product [Ectocarpus sp. 12 AP-2014]